MGLIDSILMVLAREMPQITKNILVTNKTSLIFIFVIVFCNLIVGASPGFAQACPADAIQEVNDNLDASGRQGADVLQVRFNSVRSIICRTRFGDAQNVIAGTTRITHCTPGNTTDLCFAMRTSSALQSVSIFGPGITDGIAIASNAPIDLSAGTYHVEAVVNGDTFGYSFTIIELSDDNQRIMVGLIPIVVVQPRISINNASETLESGTNGLMTISQTVLSSADNVISYTVTGTAKAGTDYAALSGSLTIPAGASTANIPIVPVADTLAEGDESVFVTLTGVTSGSATLGTSLSATNTIIDDDAATVSIANTASTLESGTNGVFTVTQSTTSTTDTIIAYSVAGTAIAGTDYNALSGSVTIAAGETTATLRITVLGDTVVEGTETVIITLTGITSGLASLGTSLEAINTITDDDEATVSIASTTDALESGTDGILTVTQSTKSTIDTIIAYTVDGTATAGTDYTTLSGSVTISAGDTIATLAIVVIGDTLLEGNETVIVTLTGVTSGSATLGTSLEATNTLIDDDVGLISIENTTDAIESETNGLLTVTQTVTSTTNTVISYSISGTATTGTDYSALSGSLSIFAGDTSAKITVPVLDDSIAEGDETVIITLTAVTSGLAKFGTSTSATNTILDDDVDINKLVAQKFRTQVHNYVSRRMTLQSRSSPSIHRRFSNGAPAQKNQSGNLDITGNSSGASGSFSFVNGFANRGPECDTCNNPFFWLEAEFSYFRDNDLSDVAVQSSGNFYIGYAGFSLPVDEYLTVGIMGQIDRFEDNLDNDLGQATGTGWAIGPYISTKLLDNLRLDVRGLWGLSENRTQQSILDGNYRGSFETERWLVEGILSGRHDIGEFSLIPSARIFYMTENWDDYQVSDGNRVVKVEGSRVEIGNLSAAMEINKTVQQSDHILETFLSGEILWDFQDPGIFDSTGVLAQASDFSSSISAGVEFSNANSSWILEATYSGLGEGGIESIGGSFSLSHRF